MSTYVTWEQIQHLGGGKGGGGKHSYCCSQNINLAGVWIVNILWQNSQFVSRMHIILYMEIPKDVY